MHHTAPGTTRSHGRVDRDHQAALRSRLLRRAEVRWPQLAEITVRFHGQQAYIGAVLTTEDEPLKLCQLAWQGSPENWRFAIHERSGDRYTDRMRPGGSLTGTPEAALDCACGLHLNDPAAYFEPPKD